VRRNIYESLFVKTLLTPLLAEILCNNTYTQQNSLQNLGAAGVNASPRRYAHNVGTGIRVRLDVGAGVIFLVALAPDPRGGRRPLLTPQQGR
jgi:hypothetical protein